MSSDLMRQITQYSQIESHFLSYVWLRRLTRSGKIRQPNLI
jgi:hypothetical protein